MSLISSSIPNMINGVSQQPYSVRLPSQAEAQINGLSSVVEGLRKRPPSRMIAKVSDTGLSNVYTHTINRDSVERYEAVVGGGTIRVFKISDGTEVTVHFPNGWDYLQHPDPQNGYSMVTVADYTFVVNKAIKVTRATPVIPVRPFEALFWVRQSAYSCGYSVTVGDFSYTYQTPDASNAANAPLIASDYVAKQLHDALADHYKPADVATHGFTFQLVGSSVHVSNATDFIAGCQDSVGDTALKLIKGTVQRFTDLPAKSVEGFKVRVQGTNDNSFDDYYVEFDTASSGVHDGVWRESAKGGEPFAMNWETLPWVLVRESDGSFSFKIANWEQRKVGDLDSVPFPSFEGRAISDIFFHRNRLAVLAGENVVFTRAGEFFNWFRASALQVLDTDVIDVAVTHTKVSNLRHACPWNETLLLFSDQTQFQLAKSDLLTPKTVAINTTTEFECSLQAKPVGAGQNLYFATNRGAYSGVREFFVNPDTRTNDAADVTAHVPEYLPKGIVKLAASTNEDVLVALSENERNALYVYQYYWSQNEKIQSSWSKWVWPTGDKILNVDFIESDMILFVSRDSGTFIERVSLEPGRADSPAPFTVHLDRRITELQVTSLAYDEVTNTTTFTLPYVPEEGSKYELVAWFGNEKLKPGQAMTYTRTAAAVTVKGKLEKFFFGRSYGFVYQLSTQIVRDQSGGSAKPIMGGRLQMRNMKLNYSNSGHFKVQVTPSYRDTYEYTFTGRILGSAKNKIGSIGVEDGEFRFPIASKNDEVSITIVNDTYLPCAFIGAEWEATFQIRSRRM